MKNKIDQSLAKLIKKKKRDDSNRIRNERGEITIIITVIPKAKKKKYYEQVYTNKLDNLKEMDKFPETHSLPKLSQEKQFRRESK